MTTTDLIIIGSGPGGYNTASYAARHGLNVIIIEEDHVGGTCLNRGCIPTKAYCHDADLALLGLKINFEQVKARKDEVVRQLRSGVETLMQAPGITLIRGHATFKDAHTITVGDEDYTAHNIIIATGSDSKLLPIPGIDGSNVITSTELLALEHLPKSLCIVGAGVIGMEFASIFNAFGTEVTVVEFLKECMPTMDSDIAKRLRKYMEKRGVKFFMQSGVKSISPEGVDFDQKGKEMSVAADLVLVATGRKPNTQGLNLEAAGVAVERGAIIVDDHYLTSQTGIYAIGDVNAKSMLAHAATFQGYRVVNELLGKKDHIRLDIMPAAVFTNPEAAGVGLTNAVCDADKEHYKVHKGFYRSNGKALATNSTEGIVKIYTDDEDKIVGCHILGAHASDMVQEVASLMNKNITLSELKDIIHIHPTLSEILIDTAQSAI